MSEFEFISVFVSIVVAFAMAELLMGWGRLIRARGRIRRPFFFIGWTSWLLLLMSFHYLGIWEYQAVDFYNVGQLVMLLLPPIVLVLLTFVLTPELVPGQSIDLEDHYFDVHHWFFGLSILFLILALAADVMLPSFASTWVSRLVLEAIMILTLVLLFITDRRAVHIGVLGFNLIYLIFGSIAQNVRDL